MTAVLSALLVDDERLARAEMKRLLAAHPEIEVRAEAASAAEAREALARVSPDVVFLDVQMPGATGFEALEAVPPACRVVFVTAYSEYALRAFDVCAVDYLVKPVRPERLATTVARLLESAAPESPVPSPAPLAPLGADDPILLPKGRTWRVARVGDITLIRAARDLSEVFTRDGKTALVSRSLKEWEGSLSAEKFLRVHRSAIVNLDAVERVEPSNPSSFRVVLRGVATPVEVSRRFGARLRRRMV